MSPAMSSAIPGGFVLTESQEIFLDHPFGATAIASDGPWLVFGPVDLGLPSVVHLYRRDQGAWVFAHELTSLQGTAASLAFGHGLAIDGDWIAVGDGYAPVGSVGGVGAVHLFRHTPSGWVEDAELFCPAPSLHEHFGVKVVLRDDLLLVANGPVRFLSDASPTLRAYQRVGGQWQLAQEIPLVGDGNGIGPQLAYDAPWLVVGEPAADPSGPSGLGGHGRALFFENVGGGFVQRLELYGQLNAHLGSGVAIEGDTALVGAPGEDNGVAGNDRVHVLRRDATGTWARLQELVPDLSDGHPSADGFGFAVSLRGDVAVVGAPWFRFDDGYDSGTAFTFQHVGGRFHHTGHLRPGDQGMDDRFGRTVHLVGDQVVASSGKHMHAVLGTPLYVFDLPDR
jgi:hypothetical protein